MTITITAFERSPDGGKGLARDTRVRWALQVRGLLHRAEGHQADLGWPTAWVAATGWTAASARATC